MNSSRLIGALLVVVGFVIALLAGIWLAGQMAMNTLQSGGAVIGAVLVFIPVALLVGGGIYLINQGGKEDKRTSEMQ
ncbi:MAG TPA: hypothetical protein VER79_01065, partial [Candidatus Limnocylindrales bacterium]|nr:hypothetical protein [Candidatus Limnocylindrales bacterium]